MIPSPLLSVDILDPQVSANNFSAGRHWYEKSHMIQITSLDKSTWQVEVW